MELVLFIYTFTKTEQLYISLAYQGHCCSCSMLVIHRHTCFNFYSSGAQFTILVHCCCMLLNAHHLGNVYAANRCHVASVSGPKDKTNNPKIENTKHLCQYILKQEKQYQEFI